MRILIVDDEFMIREWLVHTIKSLPLAIDLINTAANGEEALSILENQGYDLLFIDLQMPKMHGIELLKQVHGKYPRIRSVILTSHEEFKFAQEALRFQALDYILKNECTKDKLMEILGSCMENSMQQPFPEKRSKILQDILEGTNHPASGLAIAEMFPSYTNQPVFAAAITYMDAMSIPGNNTSFHSEDGTITALGEIGSIGDIMYLLYAVTDITHNSNQHLLKLRFMQDATKRLGCKIACGKTINTLFETGSSIVQANRGFRRLFYSEELFTCSLFPEQPVDTMQMEHLCALVTDAIRTYDKDRTMLSMEELKQYILSNHPSDIEYVKDTYVALVSTYIICNEKDSTKVQTTLSSIKGLTASIDSYANLVALAESCLYGQEGSYCLHLSPSVKEAVKFIESDYQNINSASDIAIHVHLNLDHFSRVFKKELGVPVSTYLIHYKLDIAALMIKSSTLSIKEISQRIGVSNVSYFAKRFKERFHMQPIVYRMHR